MAGILTARCVGARLGSATPLTLAPASRPALRRISLWHGRRATGLGANAPTLASWLRAVVREGVSAAAVVGVVAGGLYAWHEASQGLNRRRVLATFVNGDQHGPGRWWDLSEAKVQRPELLAELRDLLVGQPTPSAITVRASPSQPAGSPSAGSPPPASAGAAPTTAPDAPASALSTAAPGRAPVVIAGSDGTGKSTAIRQAVLSLPVPRGVVVADTPCEAGMFSHDLGEAIGLVDYVNLWPHLVRWLTGRAAAAESRAHEGAPTSTSNHRQWHNRIRPALEQASAAFKAQYGRPVTLVVDHVELLAEHDPAFLHELQEYARESAARQSLLLVLVASPPFAPNAPPPWSAGTVVFEVGDVPDHVAVAHLVHRGVALDRAEDAVRTITGGRLIALTYIANCRASTTNASVRSLFESRVHCALMDAKVSPDHALFNQLAATPRLPEATVLQLVSPAMLTNLVQGSVLAAHPDGTYSFAMRDVAVVLSSPRSATERPRPPAT